MDDDDTTMSVDLVPADADRDRSRTPRRSSQQPSGAPEGGEHSQESEQGMGDDDSGLHGDGPDDQGDGEEGDGGDGDGNDGPRPPSYPPLAAVVLICPCCQALMTPINFVLVCLFCRRAICTSCSQEKTVTIGRYREETIGTVHELPVPVSLCQVCVQTDELACMICGDPMTLTDDEVFGCTVHGCGSLLCRTCVRWNMNLRPTWLVVCREHEPNARRVELPSSASSEPTAAELRDAVWEDLEAHSYSEPEVEEELALRLPLRFEISIVPIAYQAFTLIVSPRSTVADIRRRIAVKEEIRRWRIRLFLRGRRLTDAEDLITLRMRPGGRLFVTFVEEPEIPPPTEAGTPPAAGEATPQGAAPHTPTEEAEVQMPADTSGGPPAPGVPMTPLARSSSPAEAALDAQMNPEREWYPGEATSITARTVSCRYCSSNANETGQFCGRCGKRLRDPDSEMERRITSVLRMLDGS